MWPPFVKQLEQAVRETAETCLELTIEDLQTSTPPKPEMGDVSLAFCLPLARTLKKAPRAIAESLVEPLSGLELVERVDVAGPGYLNLFLNRTAYLQSKEDLGLSAAEDTGKVVVEHSNINPNKAAHIGHLRNAVLGDTLVRSLQYLGHPVEIQNYIDDTGVQVADVVVGFRDLLGFTPEQVRTLVDHFAGGGGTPSADLLSPSNEEGVSRWQGLLKKNPPRFDVLCWHLYAQVGPWYQEAESRMERRKDALHHIENHEGEDAAMAAVVSETIQGCHLDTMGRLGIPYHVLPRESQVVRSGLWQETFEELKKTGGLQEVTEEGHKNQGCWVMPLQEEEGFSHLEEADKVIVRSNGTVTYVGKDMAYHRWKFGLSSIPLHAELFREDAVSGKVYQTVDQEQQGEPEFGGGKRVYNVIDVRQSYLQHIVKLGLKLMDHPEESDNLIHFAYEMVALTPAAAEQLGISLSDEDQQKAFIEMSGRKGLGVMADALVDEVIAQAKAAITEREGEGAEDLDDRAWAIAVSAIRYYMLKFGKNRVIAFDFKDALAFEGDTGPYLLYSVVRARNILRKYAAEYGEVADQWGALPAGMTPAEWTFLLKQHGLPVVTKQAVDQLELAHLARFGFELAQEFARFYRDSPIMSEQDEALRSMRARLTREYVSTMETLLGLLGMPIPERM